MSDYNGQDYYDHEPIIPSTNDETLPDYEEDITTAIVESEVASGAIPGLGNIPYPAEGYADYFDS